ncbi:hypothetical protein pb186bvf_008499 [Paramecium bursaria]
MNIKALNQYKSFIFIQNGQLIIFGKLVSLRKFNINSTSLKSTYNQRNLKLPYMPKSSKKGLSSLPHL